jgi:sugar phosphate isomerase/epimerase
MTTITMTRRDMLKTTAVVATAAGIPRLTVATESETASTPGISIQLYSVRKDCAQDFDKALAQVATMGFDAVEFAGYHKYGDKAKDLRAKLDELGLKVAGTHIGTGTLVGDALAKTVDFHQAIGCKYLIVPGDRRFSHPDGSKELADIFNKAAEQLKAAGMKCGYHNHTHEFKKEGDKTYWELFAERTCEDVVLQQDVGWSTVAGQDAAALIRKYPGRSQIIHCKPAVVRGDAGRPIIGEDSVKWAEIIRACEEAGGTEWLTIEQEAYPDRKTPMQCVELSLAGLKQILARG